MTKTFSPSEAALSVFQLAKRQPQFVLKFCIIYGVVTMVNHAFAGASGVGEAMKNYMALLESPASVTPERITQVLKPAAIGFDLLFFMSFISGVFLTAMGLRKAVRDEDSGLYGLQFGGDEIRLLLAMLLFAMALFCVSFVAISVIGLMTTGNMALAMLGGFLVLMITAAAGIRLSQFGVLTIAQRRIVLVPALTETKGHFGRFLGAFVLWGVIALLTIMIASIIASFGASILGARIIGIYPTSLAMFMTPSWMFYSLAMGLAGGFISLGTLCVGSYAWHQMNGDVPNPNVAHIL
jgi:hypothetical protein